MGGINSTSWIAPGALAAVLLLSSCGPKAEEAKVAEAPAAPAEPAAPAAPKSPLKEIESPGAARDHATIYRQDMTEIMVGAKGDPSGGDKLEYMINMKQGDHLAYTWEVVEGGDFWHEFHGHTDDAVTFYKKASGAAHQGSLVAPFDGIHGWYFENRSDRPVIVRLRISGFYQRVEPKA